MIFLDRLSLRLDQMHQVDSKVLNWNKFILLYRISLAVLKLHFFCLLIVLQFFNFDFGFLDLQHLPLNDLHVFLDLSEMFVIRVGPDEGLLLDLILLIAICWDLKEEDLAA